MPQGIIIGKWDDTIGVTLEAKYPESVEIADYNLMRIFTSHAVGEAQAGFLALTLEEENMNVASYFTGIEQQPQYFVALLLTKEEDAKLYEESLLDVATDLLSKIDEPNFDEILAEAYERLAKAIVLTDEQRLAQMFKDTAHKLIHERLTQGPASLTMLNDYVEQNANISIRNVDLLLAPLNRAGFTNQSWVPGFPDQFMFLVRDFFLVRAPNENIIKAAKKGKPTPKIAEKYLKEVKEMFLGYDPMEEDPEKLANLLLNNEVYEILQLIREKPMKVDEIDVAIGKGRLGSKSELKKLQRANLIKIYKDRKTKDEWVMLKADIKIHSFFPEYLLEVIRQKTADGEITAEAAIKHLELLQQNYTP
ncbi:MAG: hypothetical protein ACTSQY_06565 [Candidatus Odinarchaeia archaeon]